MLRKSPAVLIMTVLVVGLGATATAVPFSVSSRVPTYDYPVGDSSTTADASASGQTVEVVPRREPTVDDPVRQGPADKPGQVKGSRVTGSTARLRPSAPDTARDARLDRVRWMLQEYRVSLFAQQLGTAHPVSAKRIRAALAG